MKVSGKAELFDYIYAQYIFRKYWIVASLIIILVINLAPNPIILKGINIGLMYTLWVIFYYFILMPIKTIYNFKTVKAQSVTYDIEPLDNGLSFSSVLGVGFVEWKCFTKITEHKRFLLLYQGSLPANIIPLTYFSTSEKKNEFKAIIENYINANHNK